MRKYIRPFRNKFILTLTIFGVYLLFLDDVDIFTVVTQNRKLEKILVEQSEVSKELAETKEVLHRLEHLSGIEQYAREKKFFKKDNEDVFVISYE